MRQEWRCPDEEKGKKEEEIEYLQPHQSSQGVAGEGADPREGKGTMIGLGHLRISAAELRRSRPCRFEEESLEARLWLSFGDQPGAGFCKESTDLLQRFQGGTFEQEFHLIFNRE